MKEKLVCLLFILILAHFMKPASAQSVAINENGASSEINRTMLIQPAVKSIDTTSRISSTMTVFPSSVHDYCILVMQSDRKQKSECYLYDESGHLLQRKKVYLLSGSNNISWNMSSYASGVYYLTMDNQKSEKVKVTKL
jgi:hypothetical protein